MAPSTPVPQRSGPKSHIHSTGKLACLSSRKRTGGKEETVERHSSTFSVQDVVLFLPFFSDEKKQKSSCQRRLPKLAWCLVLALNFVRWHRLLHALQLLVVPQAKIEVERSFGLARCYVHFHQQLGVCEARTEGSLRERCAALLIDGQSYDLIILFPSATDFARNRNRCATAHQKSVSQRSGPKSYIQSTGKLACLIARTGGSLPIRLRSGQAAGVRCSLGE